MLDDSVWPLLVLAPFAAHFMRCALLALALSLRGQALPYDAEVDVGGFGALAGWWRRVGVWSLRPLLRWLAAAGVGPNALTTACALVCASSGLVIALGAVTLGGVLGVLGCSLDYFDGRIARLSGRASRAGAFLDGTLDRCGELALLGGAALLLRGSPWALCACLLALGSSGVVSYARAKAEALGVQLRAGLMQRPERVLLFCLGACGNLALDGLLPQNLRGQHLGFSLAIAALALLTSHTAWLRMAQGFAQLSAGEAAYTVDQHHEQR